MPWAALFWKETGSLVSCAGRLRDMADCAVVPACPNLSMVPEIEVVLLVKR